MWCVCVSVCGVCVCFFPFFLWCVCGGSFSVCVSLRYALCVCSTAFHYTFFFSSQTNSSSAHHCTRRCVKSRLFSARVICHSRGGAHTPGCHRNLREGALGSSGPRIGLPQLQQHDSWHFDVSGQTAGITDTEVR